MIMPATEIILALAVCVFAIYWFFSDSKPKNLPPGPWGFPILGHLPLLGPESYKTIREWTVSKRFGPLIYLRFGSYPTVVINDIKLIKEALNDNAYTGRPSINFFADRSGGVPKGIIFTEGNRWMEQRRFTLRHLRDFGFGKRSMESIMHEEVSDLIDSFKKKVGKPMSINNAFNAAIVNAIWSILTGERFKQDDPELARAISLLTANARETNLTTGLATFLPWFAKYFPKLSGYEHTLRNIPEVLRFLKKPIDYHDKTFEDGVHRDFLDVYIQETRNTTDPKSPFHSSNSDIQWVLIDLFVAGAETTSTTLSWAFLYLSKHKTVQQKLQQEIHKVVGNSRLPALEDKPEMPYTQAVIHELLRCTTIVPLSIFHKVTKEVELGGYTIPKDTMIMPNLYAAHFDKDAWGDPENFRPERFINEKGQFEKNDALMAFSYGKRACLGESLARDELFIFLTSLFQRFEVSCATEPDFTPVVGVVVSPKHHNYILQERA